GVNIHYEVVGEGSPIVLVHGFTLSFETNWRASGWVDFLVDARRQVVGVDCRGHGDSDKMGGWIPLNLLSRHASRFTSAVAGGAGLRSRAFDPVLRAAVAA